MSGTITPVNSDLALGPLITPDGAYMALVMQDPERANGTGMYKVYPITINEKENISVSPINTIAHAKICQLLPNAQFFGYRYESLGIYSLLDGGLVRDLSHISDACRGKHLRWYHGYIVALSCNTELTVINPENGDVISRYVDQAGISFSGLSESPYIQIATVKQFGQCQNDLFEEGCYGVATIKKFGLETGIAVTTATLPVKVRTHNSHFATCIMSAPDGRAYYHNYVDRLIGYDSNGNVKSYPVPLLNHGTIPHIEIIDQHAVYQTSDGCYQVILL